MEFGFFACKKGFAKVWLRFLVLVLQAYCCFLRVVPTEKQYVIYISRGQLRIDVMLSTTPLDFIFISSHKYTRLITVV